jgi:hypothetical protein
MNLKFGIKPNGDDWTSEKELFYKAAKAAFQKFFNGEKLSSELEKIIASDATWSCQYAAALKDRFILGEPIIASKARTAGWYARYIIRGPWPEGESGISQSAYFVCAYICDVLNGSKVSDLIHRNMLALLIKDPSDYWVLEYMHYRDWLDGHVAEPSWVRQGNWNYGGIQSDYLNLN